ncbi:hypothetical protein SAMN04487760_101170 [Lachnospiraceae bacterium G41]|nr:hypothetical protein SAMN04487760_101170 [Lachnospiraceae bacterium G41]
MEKGKIIIPIVSVLAIAGIVVAIILSTNKYKKFELPSRITVEDDIKANGYDVGIFDEKNYRKLGFEGNYEKIWAKYNDKEKNEDRDVSISFMSYDTVEDCQKVFEEFYSAAIYTENKSKHSGKVKYYHNNEKMTGYVLYNTTLESDGLVDSYTLSLTNEDSILSAKSNFLYGGVYMKGKQIVYVTTSDRGKIYMINDLLDKYGLPKP